MYTKYFMYPNQHSMNGGKWRTNHPRRRSPNIDSDKKLVRVRRDGGTKNGRVFLEGESILRGGAGDTT